MTPERWSEIHDIAERLLSNPVIEDFEVHVAEPAR
jgi:phosphoribosylformylglycinamidine (FGAM) synthase PurS component